MSACLIAFGHNVLSLDGIPLSGKPLLSQTRRQKTAASHITHSRCLMNGGRLILLIAFHPFSSLLNYEADNQHLSERHNMYNQSNNKDCRLLLREGEEFV